MIRIMKGDTFFAIAPDLHAAQRLIYCYLATYCYLGEWTYEEVKVEIST